MGRGGLHGEAAVAAAAIGFGVGTALSVVALGTPRPVDLSARRGVAVT